jgi:hypothetical protein
MFEHYLITRFNLRNPKWNVTKNNELLLTEEWMEDRIQLFKNYCLPSVVAQTNQNFKWLLYFDVTTSEKNKTQIEALVQPFSNIEIFYIDGMPSLIDAIKDYVTANCKSEYIITSRIDNDDSISKHFIDTVQQNFKQQDFHAIDFISGYTLNIKPCMIGKKEHIFNPFISLIEKNDNPKTVWFNDHNHWKKESRITQIQNQRVWMSVIHEKNKVNEFDGYGNIPWATLQNEFMLSDAINEYITQNVLPFKDWWFVSLKNQLYVKWVLFNKLFKKSIGLYRLK